jgi:4a-hydroxytetrahydrobiopterin dehydratase
MSNEVTTATFGGEMGLLTNDQIAKELQSMIGWKLAGKEMTKTFEYKDFVRAMGFVNSVALLAEKANHHPDIDIRWNKVTLTLSTHSAGGLTEKDFALANAVEQL